eukprot:tig00021796_g23553.t1
MKKGFFDAGKPAKASVPAAPPAAPPTSSGSAAPPPKHDELEVPDIEDILELSTPEALTEEEGDQQVPKPPSTRAAKRARRKRNAARRSNGTSGHAVPEAAAAWKAAPPDVDGLVSIAQAYGAVDGVAEKLAGLSFEFTASSPSAPAAPAEEPEEPLGPVSARIAAAQFAPDLCKFLGGFGPHDDEVQRIEEAHAVHVDPRSGAPLEVRVFGETEEAVAGARGELEALFASLQERRVALPALLAADLAERIQADLRAGSLPGWAGPAPAPARPAWRDESDEQESDEEEEGRGPGPAGRERVEVVVEGGELLLRGRGLPLSDLQRLSDAVAAHADALARPHEARLPIFAKEAAYVEQEGLAEEVAARHAGVQIRVERERSQPKAPRAPFARDEPRSIAHYLVVRAGARLVGERAAAEVKAALGRLKAGTLEGEVHRILNAGTAHEVLEVQADTDRDDVEAAWRSIARLLVSARGRDGAPRRLERALSRAAAAVRAATLQWGFDEAPNSTGQLLEARVELSEEQDEALRDLAAQGKIRPLSALAGEAQRQSSRPWFQSHVSVAREQDGTDIAVVFRGAEQRAGRVASGLEAFFEEHLPAVEAEAARRAKLVYETLRLSAELYDSELAAFIDARVRAGGLRLAVSVQQRTAAAVLLRLEGRLGDVEVLKAAVEREVSVLEARARARAEQEAARRRRAEQERARRQQQQRRGYGYGDDPFGGFGGGFGEAGGAPARRQAPLAHIDESKIAPEDRATFAEIKRVVKARGGPTRRAPAPRPPRRPPLTAAAQTLGLERSASESEVKKAYYMQARKFHPGAAVGRGRQVRGAGADEAFKKITAAYEELTNGPADDGMGGFGGGGGGGGGGFPPEFFNQFFGRGGGFGGRPF